jgi:hypothetical protein
VVNADEDQSVTVFSGNIMIAEGTLDSAGDAITWK